MPDVEVTMHKALISDLPQHLQQNISIFGHAKKLEKTTLYVELSSSTVVPM